MGFLNEQTKDNLAFKKLVGREHTHNLRQWYEEASSFIGPVSTDQMWTDEIPSDPGQAVIDGVAQLYDTLTLTSDATYPNRVWYAEDLGQRVTDFISPIFAQEYSVRVFDANDEEIFTSNGSNWIFQYSSGVLSFENNPTNYTNDTAGTAIALPIKIKVYKFTGKRILESFDDIKDTKKLLINSSDTNEGYLQDKITGSTGEITISNIANNSLEISVSNDLLDNLFKLNTNTTDDLTEGTTNLFFSEDRALDAIGSSLIDTQSVEFDYDINKDIRANVLTDGITVETGISGLQVKDLGITEDKLSEDAVTKDKISTTNQPTDGQTLTWSDTGSTLTWATVSEDTKKSLVSGDDTAEGFLEDKVVGKIDEISVTKTIDGLGVETLEIGLVNPIDTATFFDKTSDTSDDITEGTSNLFFSDTLAKEAVGNIFINTPSVNLLYSDVSDIIRADLNVDDTTIEVDVTEGVRVKDEGITEEKLAMYNEPIDGKVITWDATNSRMVWSDAQLNTDQVLDTVGGSLLDSHTVDFSYDGGTNEITADVRINPLTFESNQTNGISIKDGGITNDMLEGTISYDKLEIVNTPSDQQVLKYNETENKLEWGLSAVDQKDVMVTPTDSSAGFLFEKIIGKRGEISANIVTGGGLDLNTRLLMHMDGTGLSFTDDSLYNHTFTAVGTNIGQVDAQKVFGTKSCQFAGNLGGGNYILVGGTTGDFNYGNEDFTIDMWVYFTDTSSSRAIFSHDTGANRTVFGWSKSPNQMVFRTYNSGVMEVESLATFTPATGRWYHLAVVRYGDSWRIYIDGTNRTSSGEINTEDYPSIFSDFGIGQADGTDFVDYFQGFIDEVRVSKGIARWISDFTPPLSAYDDSEAIELSIISQIDTSDFFKKSEDTSDDITEGATNRFLLPGSVTINDLDSANSPTDGQLASFDITTGKLNWIDPQSGGGGFTGDARDIELGDPTEGVFSFDETTSVYSSINDIDDLLAELAPPAPSTLSGSLSYSGVTFYTGYVSGSTSIIDYSHGQFIGNITKGDEIFTGTTPNSTKFGPADKGTIELRINGIAVDSFDLEAAFDENDRDGSQSYTPANSPLGLITITNVEKYNNFRKWQIGSARVNIGSLQRDENYPYTLVHIVGTNEYALNEDKYFYDQGGDGINLNNYVMNENNITISKFLDGVRYYKAGDQFSFTFEVERPFADTHFNEPVSHLSATGFPAISIGHTDSSVSGVSTPPDKDENMNVTNYLQVLSGSNIYNTGNVTINWQVKKPGITKTYGKSNSNMFINTYGSYDTALTRNFKDNNYRLPLPEDQWENTVFGVTGNWDDTVALTNGNALVWNGLRYPNINFTTYTQNPAQTVDYSGFNGDQVYLTSMYDFGDPHSNGILRLSGITASDIGSNVKVEIKLPTLTGWLDLGSFYDAGSFSGAEGDGILVSSSGSDFTFTLGTFSTANSGWRYLLRITFKNNSKTISQIREVGW